MEKEELEEIANPDSYKWIKVKKLETEFKPVEWDLIHPRRYEQYKKLEDHHKKETEFLINKCRELANELLKYKDYYE